VDGGGKSREVEATLEHSLEMVWSIHGRIMAILHKPVNPLRGRVDRRRLLSVEDCLNALGRAARGRMMTGVIASAAPAGREPDDDAEDEEDEEN
jgi:hypothetical protein